MTTNTNHADHDEVSPEGHGHAEARRDHCDAGSTPTVISIYHLEAGEHMLEFESEDVESFRMAIAAMGGAHHHHHHDHGDHIDEHGVCHEMSDDTHTEPRRIRRRGRPNHGYMWMEEEHDDRRNHARPRAALKNHAEGEDEVVEDGETMSSIRMTVHVLTFMLAEEGMTMYDTNKREFYLGLLRSQFGH